jgi:hypothetical protein
MDPGNAGIGGIAGIFLAQALARLKIFAVILLGHDEQLRLQAAAFQLLSFSAVLVSGSANA